jgi:hypothetical protein
VLGAVGMLQVMLQESGPMGFYFKVLKGVESVGRFAYKPFCYWGPRSWILVFERFVPWGSVLGCFVFGSSFLNSRFWAFLFLSVLFLDPLFWVLVPDAVGRYAADTCSY